MPAERISARRREEAEGRRQGGEGEGSAELARGEGGARHRLLPSRGFSGSGRKAVPEGRLLPRLRQPSLDAHAQLGGRAGAVGGSLAWPNDSVLS